ncbi:hypothetical protein [Vibrio sp. J383]|uniref:hypothetical protein n=1 Tax=Vibrio sp. J383 TaxID=2942997 RepID=UPI0020C087FF|nr:hypothetical protein [Vibrio sp. J383]UQV21266.1 hypothetical protein M4S28_15295 [Vibrio sp. J383]
MRCTVCGKDFKEGTSYCEYCFPEGEEDADFVDLDNKKSGSGFLWVLIITAVLIFFWLSSGEQLEKNTFDITKGKPEYGDWYRDSLVYRTDMQNLTVILSNKFNGQAELSFVVPSSQCTGNESERWERVISVNRIPVKYFRSCHSRGFEQYIPASFQENEIVLNQFIKSDNVLVENFWFAPDALFSASGFTKVFTFMSGEIE